MKTHWLYGNGPDKVLVFEHEIDEETDCGACLHRKVCDRDTGKRCENHTTSVSGEKGCQACIHKYTRYDKDSVPCFTCPDFAAGDPP